MTISTSLLIILVSGMLFTGTINTILNKLQDIQCVDKCNEQDPNNRIYFEQPVWQTLTMFIGEALCLIVYYILSFKKHDDETTPLIESESDRIEMTGYANFLLWIPTLCDMISTTLMNVGLIYISASIYQMLRGSVVLFTGTLSTIFLAKRHPMYRWYALFMVFLGVGVVGLSSVVQAGGTVQYPIKGSWIGVVMVILAQVFTAAQVFLVNLVCNRGKDIDEIQLRPIKSCRFGRCIWFIIWLDSSTNPLHNNWCQW